VKLRLPVLLSLAAIAGCSALAPRHEPLPLPPQRLAMARASLMPPHEPGWWRAGTDVDQLQLGRLGERDGETLAIDARPIQLTRAATMEDFTKEANALNARWLMPDRYLLKRYEQTVDKTKGAKCVRAHIVTDDRETPRPGMGSTSTTTLEVLALTCTLPGSVGRGVSVSYAHRHGPERADPQFLRKATAVLDSVRLAAD